MKPRSPASPSSLRLWFAVLGAPAAWAAQFAAGYWLTEQSCDRAQASWMNAHQLATIAITVVAALTVLAAALTAIGIYRGTGGAGGDDAPPAGRNRFLAVVGMTVALLFFFIVVMNGVGVSVLSPCNQS